MSSKCIIIYNKSTINTSIKDINTQDFLCEHRLITVFFSGVDNALEPYRQTLVTLGKIYFLSLMISTSCIAWIPAEKGAKG